MSELLSEGVESIAADTADTAEDEDRSSYTLEEAVKALADDDEDEAADFAEEDLGPEEAEDDLTAEEAPTDAEIVTLSDGTELTLEEVERGFLREADYTRKTTELAEQRKALEGQRSNFSALHQNLETNLEALAHFIDSILPDEPDPALSRSDPSHYWQQKALRDGAMAALTDVFAVAQNTAEVGGAAGELNEAARVQDFEADLVRMRPELKDKNRLVKFLSEAEAFAKEMGFHHSEINQTLDARAWAVLDLARVGKIALQNRQNAARRVAAQPATKGRAPSPTQRSAKSASLKAFHRNPTLRNALGLDF